jgi:hypothetical protein
MLLKSKPRVVIYTSLFGNYESVKEPLFIDKSAIYILFTDNKKISSKNWSIEVINPLLENPRRMSRLPKILSHNYLPEHDFSVYLDSSMVLKAKNVYKMIEECLNGHDIALYRHTFRNCAYEEIKYCIKIKKEKPEVAMQVYNKYKKLKFPEKFGLFENGFIIRKNNKKIQRLNELWWEEYHSGSERDQFSLMYSLWKLGIKCNPIKIGKEIRKNPYLIHYPHKLRIFPKGGKK